MTLGPATVLWAGSMATTPFRAFAEAAGAAGFDAISVWHRTYRRALDREALAEGDLPRICADAGVRVVAVESTSAWIDGPGPSDDEEMTFRIAELFGCPLVGACVLGDALPAVEVAVERFAALCDRAAARGFDIALEPTAVSALDDVFVASEIVRGAGCTTAGLLLDTWHLARGRRDLVLAEVPAAVAPVLAVQLADAPRTPSPDLLDETMFHRLLPSAGQLDLSGFLGSALRTGPACVGVEVFVDPATAAGPTEVARRMKASLDTTVAAARHQR